MSESSTVLMSTATAATNNNEEELVLLKPNEFNTGCAKGCCPIEDPHLCIHSVACTSCTIGKLATLHAPGTFCCAGSYYSACSFYLFLTLLPAAGFAYVLGPAVAVFLVPTVGGIVRFIYGCHIRASVRRRYNISSNCCCDFLNAYLLEPCALYQEVRETQERQKYLSVVWYLQNFKFLSRFENRGETCIQSRVNLNLINNDEHYPCWGWFQPPEETGSTICAISSTVVIKPLPGTVHD